MPSSVQHPDRLRHGPLPDDRFDVAVLGAGVVGAAIARALARRGAAVALLERSHDVGNGTSKANTAILHTGFDAKPGSLEARLVAGGHGELRRYAEEVGIPHALTGAVMVAWDEEQQARLQEVARTARANGYDDAMPLDAQALQRLEPHLGEGACAGLSIPGEGIVCPWTTCLALASEALLAGALLALCAPARRIERQGGTWLIDTPRGGVRAHTLVNAAGLHADEIERQLGYRRFTVTPRRGELLVFDKLARGLIQRTILPVPSARSKGVLVAPTVYGNVLVGPTAVDQQAKDDTPVTREGIALLRAAATRIVPGLAEHEVTATYAGLRAATEHSDYQIHHDAPRRYVCVGGIRSTGLTASLAIARHVVAMLDHAGLDLDPTESGPRIRMPNIGERSPRPYQRPELIARDPEYGRIACFCERVSHGEIGDALDSPIPPVDVGGLRRRTRATMGRCQGFYCGAAVAARIAERRAA